MKKESMSHRVEKTNAVLLYCLQHGHMSSELQLVFELLLVLIAAQALGGSVLPPLTSMV